MHGKGLPFISALIATKRRWGSLTKTSIPTITGQRRRPDCLLVVSDRRTFDVNEVSRLRELADGIEIHVLHNQFAPGAAGAWNTGLGWLEMSGKFGYVAILDDDDEWDSTHLELCEDACTRAGGSDVVLSGLRMVKAGAELHRAPLTHVSRNDFLAGNPGWQGSNTFVKLSTLTDVGGFTNGLASTNDRDLAVRLLSVPGISVAFTHEMTATWHMDSQPDALSRRGGPEKRAGLSQFLRMHGHLMDAEVRDHFVTRARTVRRGA